MQLSFSDIVSLDADTFFIPLSLCFQSAIKVIGGSVCEYFDSMVKSDNSDLKWPLEDVKFRQDLWLSLLQIQMVWLQHSWLLVIGWSTLFCFLIGKSRNSTSLSGWCLCLEDSQCEPCDNQDFSHDEIQQPFVLFLSTPYSYFSFKNPSFVCRFICSTETHDCLLVSNLSVSFKYSKEGKKLSPRVKFLWTRHEALSRPGPLWMQASDWPLVSPSWPLIGHYCSPWALMSTAWSPGERWARCRARPNMQISWPRASWPVLGCTRASTGCCRPLVYGNTDRGKTRGISIRSKSNTDGHWIEAPCSWTTSSGYLNYMWIIKHLWGSVETLNTKMLHLLHLTSQNISE